MNEITIKKGLRRHVIMMYDSIEDLPITLFSKVQKYQLVEQGIGSTIGDFDEHFEALVEFVKHDKKDKVVKELSNLRHLFWHSLNEINPSHLGFCCLVQSINGKEITDYSEESLKRIKEKLSEIGLTQKILKDNDLKKKSMIN